MNKNIGIVIISNRKQGGNYSNAMTQLKVLSESGHKQTLMVYCVDDEILKFCNSNNILCKKMNLFEDIKHIDSIYGLLIKLTNHLRVFKYFLSTFLKLRDLYYFVYFSRENLKVVIFTGGFFWHIPNRIKTIAFVNDLMHIYCSKFPEVTIPSGIVLRNHYYHLMSKFANLIVVDSKLGNEHFSKGYKRNHNIYVLPFSVSEELINAIPTELKSLSNITNKYFFYPAQFWPHKNHLNLLKGFDIFHQSNNEIHLVLVGDTRGVFFNKLLNYVDTLKSKLNIHFIDTVTQGELKWLYLNANSLVYTSFFGPTNIPPIEAQTFSCPVACANVFDMKNQLTNGAIYFNPDSAEEIAQALNKLQNDSLRQELILNGKIIHNNWNFRHYAKRYLEILSLLS